MNGVVLPQTKICNKSHTNLTENSLIKGIDHLTAEDVPPVKQPHHICLKLYV